MSITEISAESGVTRPTISRYLKQLNINKNGNERVVYYKWGRDPRGGPVQHWYLGNEPNEPKPKPRDSKEYQAKYRAKYKQLAIMHGWYRIPISKSDIERVKNGLPTIRTVRRRKSRASARDGT